ncbi:MAG TPA: alanine--tRNA ligase [Gemmatimonadota bacterium]|nr:alanine--tRNA ligase [Gemmatimonadota bacterium]
MTGHEIRQRFIDYFVLRGHTRVASAPLVPEDDPTLLFVNAGMVPFKDVFTGGRKLPYDRAVTAQKCLRVSGKHNDFENVGYTPRHHTFFEMLGNFSFGDYFKRDAIAFAWEFLTVDLGLPAERLWASVHQDDDEAARLWPEVTPIPAERVIRLGDADNFWAMGETGPCGPCSEIFWDFGPDRGPGTPADNDERFLEIWNLVFMQFERSADGVLTPLPKPSVDTGMGLERIAAVVQGRYSNYASDLFTPLLEAIAARIGRAYESEGETGVSFRVLADHVRAATFLIADGVYPSNEGRGYVLRRIIRRAVRHYWLLDVHEPVLCDVTRSVVAEMGGAYPDLTDQASRIETILRAEEERFLVTIDQGMGILDNVLAGVQAGETVPGEDVFRLYDTYGFPPDLTELIARERGHGIDQAGYTVAMERQREQSRAGSHFTLSPDSLTHEHTLSSTEIRVNLTTQFVGYETLEIDTMIDRMGRAGDRFLLVLRENPFYATGGGQVADIGTITGDGFALRVVDVRREGDAFVPVTELVEGDPSKVVDGASVHATVDADRRAEIERHHTVTHVLHAILRERLGDHVRQAGSLVAPERMRFDFSSPTPLGHAEIEAVEDEANRWVLRDLTVTKEVVPIEQAREREAMALFGEKYGDTVRVVTIGDGESVELCGGCHVERTGEIGAVRIVSESSAAAGVRRIEVVTGLRAIEETRRREALLGEAAAKLRVSPEELPARIERLLEEKREAERSLEAARKQAHEGGAGAGERTTMVDGFQVLTLRAHPASMDDLRAIGDSVRNRLASGVGVIGAEMEGKAHLLTVVTDDLIRDGRLDAPRVVRELAAFIGGGGGGKKHMAQAGGKDVGRLDEALERAPEIVGGLVSG